MTAELSEFERANRLEVARAVRDGRLSRREGADFLLERAMRRLERVEAKPADEAAEPMGAALPIREDGEGRHDA